jgi:hypothetical protein
MPGAGSATLIGIALIVLVIVIIVVCRLLAGVIRDINRYDAGLPAHKRKNR